MSSLQSFLGEAKEMTKKKVYVEPTGEKPDVEDSADRKSEMKYSTDMSMKKKKGKMATCNGYFLMSDFGVPMWQRAAIEAKEGFNTLKGVGKDLISKKAWTDPKKNKQWTEDLGRGYAEARNRVQSSLRKANDSNIAKELEKNKSLDLQIDKMRQAGKKKYAAEGAKNLSRSEADGVLSIDKRYKRG